MICLSIRQPWPWFIFHAHPPKDVENREWTPQYAKSQIAKCPPGTNVLIHASKECTHEEFLDACDFALKAGCLMLPRYETLELGGIVGMVTVSAYVRHTASRWFVPGCVGIKLENPYPLKFTPAKGALGFFRAPPDVFSLPLQELTQNRKS